MRIIAGEFRRRPLNSPPGMVTRPIPDRVKESFYSMLGTRIQGAQVVDLFCGSGSIGLEAVSRGAKSVVMVERSKRIAQVVQSNINLLKVQDRVKLVHGDALGLAIVARIPQNVDLVFMDPPYDMVRQPGGLEWDRVRQQASIIGKQLAPDGFLIIRTPWPFIFDSPEVSKRREQLKLLAQGKLTATISRKGGPSLPSIDDDVSAIGNHKPGDKRGGNRRRNRGKGSGGRNDLLRGGRDHEFAGPGAVGRRSTDTGDGDGWLDPELIKRELDAAGMPMNVAGLDDAGSRGQHADAEHDHEQDHDDDHEQGDAEDGPDGLDGVDSLDGFDDIDDDDDDTLDEVEALIRKLDAKRDLKTDSKADSKPGSKTGSNTGSKDDSLSGGSRMLDRSGGHLADERREYLENASRGGNSGPGKGKQSRAETTDGGSEHERDFNKRNQAAHSAARDAQSASDFGDQSEDDILRELGLDPKAVKAAGGLRALTQEEGDEELDRMLSEAHKQANADKYFGDLTIPGLRGPETHIYGSTAVHWYMLDPNPTNLKLAE